MKKTAGGGGGGGFNHSGLMMFRLELKQNDEMQ